MNPPGQLDLGEVTELLHERAPRLREGELEAVKLRVLARAPKGPAMRSRLTITAALVAGVLMSFSGVALGVSGISSSGSAGTAQYVAPGQTPSGQQLPNSNSPGTTNSPGTPETISSPGSPAGTPNQVKAAEQRSSSPIREIPFTGFLAIPALLIGVALLAAGMILRRRALRI